MEESTPRPMPTVTEAYQRHHDVIMRRKLAGTLTDEDAAQLALAEKREAEGLVKPYEPPAETPVSGTESPSQG